MLRVAQSVPLFLKLSGRVESCQDRALFLKVWYWFGKVLVLLWDGLVMLRLPIRLRIGNVVGRFGNVAAANTPAD